MDGFLTWFFDFISAMLDGFVSIIRGIFNGIVQIFNIPNYVHIFSEHAPDFTALDWILSVAALFVVAGIWGMIGYLIYMMIRRHLRLRKTIINQEDVFEEIADLHKQVTQLTEDRDRILSLQMSQSGVSAQSLAEALSSLQPQREAQTAIAETSAAQGDSPQGAQEDGRFYRLSQVDEKYKFYTPPEYYNQMSLSELCEDIRNFACSQMHLYYDIDIIRFMLAGMSSTKLILLQGISGTGKTSLPYCMGKYFTHDTTIASVQPSWRDRTELFGYFNEFTKKFNETEVLRRIYEASYNDDMNLIILDEMNIARVEYYFAEMLSILEMPDHNEWKLDLVASSWDDDPKHLKDGKLSIPENVWYIGTANNDDSTYAVSDKVYDRALTINLDSKGEEFDAPQTQAKNISYSYLEQLFEQAWEAYPVSQENLSKIGKLDIYIIQKLRIAFGNRIMKQLKEFVPVYVACGGTELDGIDYILATKVFRKFESLNLSLIRDEIKDLSAYLTKSFGKTQMTQCKVYLERLQKMF